MSKDRKVRVVRECLWTESDRLHEHNAGPPWLAFPWPEDCPISPEEYVRLNRWHDEPCRVVGLPYLSSDGRWFASVFPHETRSYPVNIALHALTYVPEEGERCKHANVRPGSPWVCPTCGAQPGDRRKGQRRKGERRQDGSAWLDRRRGPQPLPYHRDDRRQSVGRREGIDKDRRKSPDRRRGDR